MWNGKAALQLHRCATERGRRPRPPPRVSARHTRQAHTNTPAMTASALMGGTPAAQQQLAASTAAVDRSDVAAAAAATPDAESLWRSLSEVERTCLQVAFVRWRESHRTWPDGRAWYADPYGELWVNAAIPEKEQAKMREWQAQGDRIADVMAVRTAELDSRIHDAVFGPGAGSGSLIRQLVIVGAGADMRAWRLPWPKGFKLFEVDSAAVLDFKARVLRAAGQVFAETLTVARVEVVADAAKPSDMWDALLAAGLDAGSPVFFLLEGLIGYLTAEDGSELLATLQANSQPGSHIIVTVPPGPAVKAAKEAAKAAAAAAAAAGSAQADDAAAPAVPPLVHMGHGAGGGVTTVQANMPHVNFETPEGTHSRVITAGWGSSTLLTAEWLAQKYGVAHAQPIVVARKA